jgi:hypothetical protein
MQTEEGKLKDRIKAHLDSIGAYRHMPVLSGYGNPALDFVCCIGGRFLSIETKAPGKKPTPRQQLIMRQIIAADGTAFWVDSFEQYMRLMYEAGFILYP